jgi:hypothetical protein
MMAVVVVVGGREGWGFLKFCIEMEIGELGCAIPYFSFFSGLRSTDCKQDIRLHVHMHTLFHSHLSDTYTAP